MKQRLGTKKLKLCREIGGKPYVKCLVRGGREHFWAECWYDPGEDGWLRKYDFVNYKTKEVEPVQ
jgi:hypothetical protein